jgi:hypothetical protein
MSRAVLHDWLIAYRASIATFLWQNPQKPDAGRHARFHSHENGTFRG